MPEFSEKALALRRKRYLLKDEKGRIETPEQMLRRVAHTVAQVDLIHGKNPDAKKTEGEFYGIMANLEFLPNSPALMNAGTSDPQLSSCFVLPVSERGLAEKIHKSGGGTGFSFSGLPAGSMKNLSKKLPQSGANMGVLSIDHPGIHDFVSLKSSGGFSNFNFSVGMTDDFFLRVKKGHPESRIFRLIAEGAWLRGDPGMLFLDQISGKNQAPALGKIEATSACGEAPLLPYESCILGSINLPKMISSGKIDFQRLEKTVRTAVRFLDNAIDAGKYPSSEIEKSTKSTRKIGIGVMGFADALALMGIPYCSRKAEAAAERTMKFINGTASNESEKLAGERGPFPAFGKSILKRERRNATLTAISPTGSRSLIAGCSPGIEPVLEKAAQIPLEWHVRVQAAFQKHTDNSISKTVNLPKSAKISDVEKVFLLAWRLKCKGVSVYRDGSLANQPVKTG